MNTEYLQIAHQIGARLCRDALWSLGRCNWIGHYLDGETLACGALGPEIYSGTSGIALFLWRLAEATGDRIIRVTAEGALRQALARMPMPGCGLYAGGLSVLFAAAEIRGECGEDEILRQAEPDSSRLDVVSGSAGAIAALLHLRRHGGARWLDRAMAHGDLLLATADRSTDGWSWKTTDGPRNLTGFSHGAAGIGWAMLELWAACGEDRFRLAAVEAFRYERSAFHPGMCNWPDFRQDPPIYPAVWCHGAGGIGFSRLRAWQILGDAGTLAEARTAVAKVADVVISGGSFCQCHGVAGNADLLLYASQSLGEEKWLARAHTAARYGVEQYHQRRAPWPCGLAKADELPGLMLGLAGIGYFYLRMADPQRVPSVLLTGG